MMAPLQPGSFKGIVFDLDGTLIDSYEAIAESLNHALAGLGFAPVAPAGVRAMVGRGLETLMGRAMGERAVEDPGLIQKGVDLFRDRYDAICVAKTSLLPGVAETVPALAGRGYRMSVATNKPSYFARRLLDELGIGRHLDAVIGPDLASHHKPHPEVALAALAAMRLDPREALYVGDMEVDVQTARAAGMSVVVLPTGSSSLDELAGAGADLIVPAFASLLDLLPGPLIESRSS